MRKGGVHEKTGKAKRANEKRNLKREWYLLITLILIRLANTTQCFRSKYGNGGFSLIGKAHEYGS